MGEERNFEFFIGDCQLPAVVLPESTKWLLPADSNESEVSGSIKTHVDKAAESGDRMSSCRYGNISGEFTLDVERSEGLDELLLEILYGDRIRKTIERLNNEWLKKMWKVSEDDLMIFKFEQIAKKFDSSLERRLSARERLEELRETGGVIVVQPSHTSAVREILDPYIGEDGFIKECGLRKVHTEEHGDFCIILYHNPSEVMALRAFYLNSKKK